MTRIAVTGASGFLGRHLLQRLLRDEQEDLVVGSVRRMPPDPLAGVHYATGRVSAELVFHLAGSPGIISSLSNPKADLDANVGTLLALLEQVPSRTRIVLASSYAVYGRAEVPFEEDAPLQPEVPYGVSKATAEAYLRILGGRKNLDIRIARIANAYGPRQTKLALYELAQKALAPEGQLLLRGPGTTVRDFIHAADVAEALVRIALHGAPGGIYNVGTGRVATLAEVGRIVAEAAGLPPDAFGSDPMADKGKPQAAFGDVGRLAGLGFRPLWSLEDGIRDTVAWIRSQG